MKSIRTQNIRMVFVFLLLVLISFVSSTVVLAAGNPTVTVAKAESSPGAEVAVTVTMKDNPGIVNMQLSVAYDSHLTLIKVEDGKILGDSVHTANYTLNPYQLTWQNDTAPSNFTNDGVCSWADFAAAIMREAGLPCRVRPITTAEYPSPAVRPAFSTMSKDKIVRDFRLTLKPWEASLRDCLQRLKVALI